MGVAASDQGHTDCEFGCDCGRYVEIWNLVFMQFDRRYVGQTDSAAQAIDRYRAWGWSGLRAVLQGVISNFETDLFTPLIKRAAELTGQTQSLTTDDASPRTRRLGHNPLLRCASSPITARAATFLISDGVLPANEGRGYVLRKIMRRAIRHGRLLGQDEAVSCIEMVFAVRDLMEDAYPELNETADRVAKVVQAEETRFAQTWKLDSRNLRPLTEETSTERACRRRRISSCTRRLACRWTSCRTPRAMQGIEFDRAGFDACRGRAAGSRPRFVEGRRAEDGESGVSALPKSEFEGYRQTRSEDCEVLAIMQDGAGVQELKAGEEGEVVLDHTPFYADSGGQVGDRGWLYSDDHNTVVADVRGCY